MKTFRLESCAMLTAMLYLASSPAFAVSWDGDSRSKIDMGSSGYDWSDSSSSSSSNSTPAYSGPSAREIRKMEDAARIERNARLTEKNQEGNAAYERGDYREALRIYYEQQQMRDGPNVQQSIAAAQEMIGRVDAQEQAEHERLAREAKVTADNEQYERDRPEREARAERERIARDAENVKVAAQIHDRLSAFAASLDTAAPPAGWVVTKDGTASDAMGTHQAKTMLQFGDPHAPEAASEQMRQGFDKDGPLAGTAADFEAPTAASGEPDVAAGDSRMIAATEEMSRLQAEHDLMDADIVRLTKERNTASDTAQMNVLTAELDRKNQAKQEKLVQISQTKEKKNKLHRTIMTEVKKTPAAQTKGNSGDKKN